MSLGSFSGMKGNDNPFAVGMNFNNRESLTFSENRTESTAAESMFSASGVSVGKNGSIVDIGRRTSFAKDRMRRFTAQNLQNRSARPAPTEPVIPTNFSAVQIMDRPSLVAEESSTNKINVEPITKTRDLGRIEEEEKKQSFEDQIGIDSCLELNE